MPKLRVIDLSYTIRPHWRWQPRFERPRTHAQGSLFQVTVLQTEVHAFTHVDAPLHVVPGGTDITSLPLDALAGEAAVIDLRHVGASGAVTAEELEARGQHVQPGDIVLLRTDWDRQCDIAEKRFWLESPYLTRGGAEWLRGRQVRAVGFDFAADWILRQEVANPGTTSTAHDYTTHDVLLRNGVQLIEYLANLASIPGPRTFFMALPLKIEGADGSPVRAVALEWEQ